MRLGHEDESRSKSSACKWPSYQDMCFWVQQSRIISAVIRPDCNNHRSSTSQSNRNGVLQEMTTELDNFEKWFSEIHEKKENDIDLDEIKQTMTKYSNSLDIETIPNA